MEEHLTKANRRESRQPVGLRIIGGRFRGRKLRYSGEYRVRPMKDRVREAVFNLLGPSVEGKHAVDLFAGTGALGLEALSRGASRALFIESHHPTAAVLRENITLLGVEDAAEVVVGSVFLRARWQSRLRGCPETGTGTLAVAHRPSRKHNIREPVPVSGQPLSVAPWLVFCSPPYAYYASRHDEMLDLVASLWESAPVESLFVVESDEQFDPRALPCFESWDVRPYRPAVIAIGRRPAASAAG